jgi:hypothetical protein
VNVLLGVHCPRIDIEVRIYFDGRDVLVRQHDAQYASKCSTYLETNGLEQQTRRGGCSACRQFYACAGLHERHTYYALAQVSSAIARRYMSSHLPHAADDAARHEYVFHGCLRRFCSGLGEGEGREVQHMR